MTLNRAHPLCRNMIFAAAAGESKGFCAGTFQSDVENISGARMQYNAAVLNASPWQGGNEQGGQGLDNGDGSFVTAPEALSPAGTSRYAPDPTGGFSALVLVRPDVLSTDATIPIFKCRNQPYGATDAGWHFSAKAGNQWRFAYSDGVNERSVGSVTSQDPNLIRGDLLIATISPDMTTLNLWVNGTLEGAPVNPATNMGNVAGTPIKFLGLGTAGAGQPNYAGLVSIGYVWTRTLTNGEINMLTADPFLPWRQVEEDYGALADFIAHQHKWALKPRRPSPNRADSLWRGVLHANAPWVWGSRADDHLGEYDDISGTRAPWANSGLADASAFLDENYGRSIQQGNPSANAVPKWPLNGSTRYDVTSGGFSFATLVRPNSLTTEALPIYKRRSTPYNNTNAGWGFFPTTSGANYRASICDGTTQVEVVSNSPMDTTQPTLLVAVYDNSNVLSLYVNGILEDQSPPTALVAANINDPAQTLNMLGVGSVGTHEFPGSIGLGVLWNRPLSASDIRRLYTDPFIMWRQPDEDAANLAFQTYFHVF